MEDITIEDIKVDPNWTPLDLLAAICDKIREKQAQIVNKIAMQENSPSRMVEFPKSPTQSNAANANKAESTRELKNTHEDKQERLKRERKLKRPMHELELETSKRYYDQQDKRLRIDEIPPMPQIVKDRINQLGKKVKEVKLIIEKEIYKTDASKTHNRLSIPTSQIVEKFLTDEEEEYLCMCISDNKKNLKKVRVIDPSLDIGELELRRWEMKKQSKSLNQKCKMSVMYALNGNWTKMPIRNKIKEHNRIQIWAVRMDDNELIIVLVKLPPPNEEEEEDEVTLEE